jgi:PAS domain S-box-containing protein
MDRGDLVGPVVIHSADTIEHANEAFCDLVGADSPAAVTGRPLDAFVADQYHGALADRFDSLLREGGPVHGLAIELAGADGDRRDVVAVSSLVEWEGTTRIHTSVMDIADPDTARVTSPRETAAHDSPIGVTIADANADDEPLIYVNDAFCDLTGYAREKAVGRNCRFLQGPDTREEPVAEMRAAIDAERPVTVTLRNYRRDGSLFWNRITVSPVRDAAGEVTHFLGFQEDVTETKLNEQEKTLFETAAEMSDQVMFITDTEGTIEYVNPAFERVTGYTAAEAVGQDPAILRSGQQDEAFYEEMWGTITDGEVWESELTNRTKSGEFYRCRQRIVPITGDRGEITHFAAIEPDITDERLADQALDVLNRILRHNVRTAVNVIDGYTDILASDPEEPERETAIRTIRERTAALQQISERTTTLRDLLEGRSDPVTFPVSRIEPIVAEFREEYPDADIDLQVLVPGDRRIRNGEVFRIALEEIVENGVVHADREPRIEITVADAGSDDAVEVRVADNGPGIPESEWEVVKNGSETPLQHANSIGLWLIYWSVIALGGSIELTDNEPRGSVLVVRAPSGSRSEREEPAAGSQV